jgi:hypothetical protein
VGRGGVPGEVPWSWLEPSLGQVSILRLRISVISNEPNR